MNEEVLVVEAGMLWRFVARRFEQRVNSLLKTGHELVSIHESTLFLHLALVARLRKLPAAEPVQNKSAPRDMHG
jgi:hypothetical protein